MRSFCLLKQLLIFGAASVLDTGHARHYQFISVGKQGYNLQVKDPESLPMLRLQIAKEQCSGELEFPRDYQCMYNDEVILPASVEIEVLDDEGPAKIIFSSSGDRITIYRVECNKAAILTLRINCNFFDHWDNMSKWFLPRKL